MAEPLRERGLEVCCDVAWDRPLDEGIVRKTMQSPPFLVIKDTHYHSKLARSLFGSTDWNLIRTCPSPLLFVKHHSPWQIPVIISAVNPINETEKELDRNILRFGELLKNNMNAKHEVLHICKPLSVSYVVMSNMGYAGSLKKQYQELVDMHKNYLNNLVDGEKFKHENVIFMEGNVKHMLPSIVEEKNADIVIMGSISKSRLEQAFIGGTTEAVLNELDCDVLVLKPDGFKTPVSPVAPVEYPLIIWPM